jgi:hypothetical protein
MVLACMGFGVLMGNWQVMHSLRCLGWFFRGILDRDGKASGSKITKCVS